MQNELESFIKANRLEKNVKILNNITNPYPYILKSDLFVLSSLYEGLPNVLLEALTLNKFIISTNCSTGPSEILINGKGGILVPIKDHIYLGNKILYYNSNKKRLRKKILFAKKKLSRFDINNNLNSFLKILN